MKRLKLAMTATIVALSFASLAVNGLAQTRPMIDNPHFLWTYIPTDRPVADGLVDRSWIWGETVTPGLQEPYTESPGGHRTVQYFDKSRMEITHPDAELSIWYVTHGLLVIEMMTGQLQLGDNTFEQHQPADINVSGNADDPTAPTYATMAALRSAPAYEDGSVITQRVHDNGVVTKAPSLASFGVTAGYRVTVPGIDHQVASVFWDFMNSEGPI